MGDLLCLCGAIFYAKQSDSLHVSAEVPPHGFSVILAVAQHGLTLLANTSTYCKY